jgi:hypothetical protein
MPDDLEVPKWKPPSIPPESNDRVIRDRFGGPLWDPDWFGGHFSDWSAQDFYDYPYYVFDRSKRALYDNAAPIAGAAAGYALSRSYPQFSYGRNFVPRALNYLYTRGFQKAYDKFFPYSEYPYSRRQKHYRIRGGPHFRRYEDKNDRSIFAHFYARNTSRRFRKSIRRNMPYRRYYRRKRRPRSYRRYRRAHFRRYPRRRLRYRSKYRHRYVPFHSFISRRKSIKFDSYTDWSLTPDGIKSVVQKTFVLNSLVSPFSSASSTDGTITGSKNPLGYDELMNMYDYAICNYFKLDTWFQSASFTSDVVIGQYFNDNYNNLVSTGSNYFDFTAGTSYSASILHAKKNISTRLLKYDPDRSSTKRITVGYPVRKLFRRTGDVTKEEDLRTTGTSTDPNKICYVHMLACNAQGGVTSNTVYVIGYTRLTQYATLFHRDQLEIGA